MADTPREQNELNKGKQEQLNLEQRLNQATEQGRRVAAEQTIEARNLTDELRRQLGIKQRRTDAERELLSLAQGLQKISAKNAVELGRSNSLDKELIKNQQNLSDLAREELLLKMRMSGTSQKEAERAFQQYNELSQNLKEQEKIEQEIYDLRKEGVPVTDESIVKLKERNNELETTNVNIQEELKVLEDSNKGNVKKLLLNKQLQKVSEDNLGILKAEAEVQDRLTKAAGLTGASLGIVNKLLGSIGAESAAISKGFEEGKNQLRAAAENAARQGESLNFIQRVSLSLGPVFKGIRDTLFSTEAIFSAILKTAMAFNAASVESRRLTGQTLEITQGLEPSFASTVDQLKLANEITKELGFNAMNIMSPSTLAGAANLQVSLGLSAHEAKNFAIFAEKGGYEVNNLAEGVVKQVNSFNKANKAAVSQGQILKDVGNVSKAISASLGSNPKAIAEAAAAARRLGLDLKTVDGIADSLLDFESSIGNEIEAQLLTGKQINMSKARELALNNDLAGLGKELFNNAVDIAEFGKMNRIQQEAQAKALGMTRDQLAKVAYLRALEKGMTEDQAAAAANVNLSDMQRMTAAENFQKAIERITGAFAPLLNVVADFLSMPLAPYILLGAVALTKLSGVVKSISSGIALLRTLTAASTVATNVDTASKIANSTATTALAGSTTALSTTSAAASTTIGASMRAIAMGFAAFASPPVALGVAVVTGAVLGLGAALYMAKDAVVGIAKAIGNTIVGIFQALPPIITAVSDGFNNILETITLEKAAAVGLLGLSFISLAGGLTILSASIFTSLPGIAILGSIAMMGSGLMNAGSGMERLVAGVKDLKSALNQLEIEKLKELEDFTAKTAIAAPITTVEGAITSLGDGVGNVLSNITGGISNVVAGITGGRGGNNAALEAKLDELIAITAEGKTIVMDGSVVGNTITRVSPKSS